MAYTSEYGACNYGKLHEIVTILARYFFQVFTMADKRASTVKLHVILYLPVQ